MDSDTPLDYALFQLSPRRTRCELFVSGDGKTEKLASGFLKPFVTHLKVAEEQAAQAVQSIKLEVEKRKNGGTWFNKGTLERFVRFVSTPEVLELVNTFDAEVAQLEGARRIYSQGAGDSISDASGEHETATVAAADITKRELLKAIDVRLVAVKQDLTTACARASSAGFTIDNVSELLLFAEQFGAHRLKEACNKFIMLCQRRPELISHQHSKPSLTQQWKGFDDGNVRSSSGSDMSIDEPEVELRGPAKPLNIGVGSLRVHKPSNSQSSQRSTDESPASCQQPKPISGGVVEREVESNTAEPIPIAASVSEPAQQSGGGSRRLSVQDRINLFENKQKQQASGSNATNSGNAAAAAAASGGGSKVVVGKGEHRRTPSDISVEKSVLRRWSGASDMSIDLNCSYSDRKDCGSAAGTPTSANLEEEANGLKDTVTSRSLVGSKGSPSGISLSSSSSLLSSSQVQTKAFTYDKDHKDEVTTISHTQSGSDLKKEQANYQTSDSVKMVEAHGFSDQASSQVRQNAFQGSSESAGLKEDAAFRAQSKSYSEEHVQAKDQAALQIPFRDVSAVPKQVGRKDREGLQLQPREVLSETDGVGLKGQSSNVTQFRTFVRKTENVEVKSRGSSDSRPHFKASSGKEEIVHPEGDLQMQTHWRSTGKPDEIGVKEAAISELASFPVKAKQEDAGRQGINLRRQSSGPDQLSKLRGSRDEMMSNEGKTAPVLPGRKAKEIMEISHPPSASLTEQIQVARPSKGNQELNNELQMKANELEKLFAAHKLRVNNDQMASSRRSKPSDIAVDHAPKAVEGRSAMLLPNQLPGRNIVRDSSNGEEFDANFLLKMVDGQEYGSNMKQKLGALGPSDDVRGKFYEKYMQKRDAKLRAEWASERAQREAKMKAMHDSLDRSQAEMKAKFVGCASGQDLTNARRRAEKLMAYGVHSALRNKDQQAEDSYQGEQEVIEELYEQIYYGEDKSDSDNLFGDGSSKSNSKKFLSNKSLSSLTPRTSLAAIPKPSARATNSGPTKRRAQPENPLAQSVPNFSDFRKENTKPSTGISRANTRAQSKNYSRSKSITEEMDVVKEDKPRRSQSMRKSPAAPGELKDLSPLNSDSIIPTPYRFSNEQSDPTFLDIVQKSGESKQILRKGNGVGPGAGVGVVRLKTSVVSEALETVEDFEAIEDQQEDPLERFKEGEEFERTSFEGNLGTTDFALDSDGEKPRHEFEDSDDPGSEDDVPRSLSHADDDPSVSSKFVSFAGNLQDSPGASPGSWNSHIQHSFAYAHEASDIDALLDSPTGSPASWNSHPLNQMMGADAARMRKKWGSAQIPMLVANASQQPRKDVTKGIKRLLKFGRKSRGVESLATDWVSASTASEGDDDTEDGRDLVQHSSDDLRKSRMGYSLPSYDSFNEGDMFSEQAQSLRSSIPNAPANFKLREDHLSGSSIKAPRSFFSLSSFRSKGSESKLR